MADKSKIRLCECGCGQPAPLASKTNKKRGWVKGQPIRFIHGHASRKQSINIAFQIDKKTGCWIWQGSRISTGYGNLRVNGEYVLAHRYIYELINGQIPAELEIDHLCKNPRCINPKHLEAVTHAENCRRGSRAKLNHKLVRRIRRLHKEGKSIHQLARTLDIHYSTVRSAIHGKAWS